MGLIIRQSIKSSIGYYLGVILGAINTLFISTHFLNSDELAISRLLIENSIFFATFVHLGSPHIIDRFFSRFKNAQNGHNGMLLLMLVFPFVGLITFGLFYLLFKGQFQGFYEEKSSTVIQYLWLSLPMAFFWALIMVFEAFIRANQRIAIPTFLRETLFRILNIASIIAYGFDLISFNTFLIINALFLLVLLVILAGYLYHLNSLSYKFSLTIINKEIVLEALKFGGLVIIGSLGVNLVLFIDRNIIAQKLGTESVAIFIIASYIASTIEIPAKALKQISIPILSANLHKNEMIKVDEIYKKSALNLMLIGGIMLVLVCVNIDSILGILPHQEIYSKGKWIVIIIAASKWFDMSLGLNNEMISLSKYFKFNTFLIVIMAILVVFLNYLLIPIIGLLGSAITTAIVTLFSSMVRLFFVHHKFKMMPFCRKELQAFLIFGLLMALGLSIPSLGYSPFLLICSIGFKSMIIMLLFIFCLIRFNISQDITYLYLNFKNKFFKG